ncbi:MAG: hypothetical protein JSW52_03890 [Candidatus Coatesbacteria bacterium]|nr:MAG: hypothetical protein JSW52_03890 [Candidatus Coatesbacteria bacterium]
MPSYSADGWAQGHWARYEYSVGGGKPAAITVAVTGSEERGGGDFFWLEILYETGGYARATRVLTPELALGDFFRAEGDVPPGAIEIRRRDGALTPYEVSLYEATDPSAVSIQKLFGGGPGAVLMETRDGVEYEALSGKDLICEEYVLSLNGSGTGTVYASDEVPVTGVAWSAHGSAVLELVDFGLSGAGSAF